MQPDRQDTYIVVVAKVIDYVYYATKWMNDDDLPPGIDYTRAGFAVRALALAAAWLCDPYAYRDTIRMYLS